jgi:hypothetical protein
MSDLDPQLQALFARDHPRELAGKDFIADTMQRLDRQRRRAVLGRMLTGVLLAVLAVPLQDPTELLTEYLLAPLIDVQSPVGQLIFSPVSSVGALLSLGLLGLRYVYKRLLR